MTTQTLTKPKNILENGKPSEVILKWNDFQKPAFKNSSAF